MPDFAAQPGYGIGHPDGKGLPAPNILQLTMPPTRHPLKRHLLSVGRPYRKLIPIHTRHNLTYLLIIN